MRDGAFYFRATEDFGLVVCLQEGYSWRHFREDAGAGIVVGLVALPLAMAFAIASGLPPERGIFTAIVAGLIISLFGGSRVQIGGPTGAFVVIVGGIVAQHGYNGLVWATLMAGAILIIMGLARMGTLVKFIPYPVTTGFTSGIAVVIFSGQVKDFFGLSMPSVPVDFIDKWPAYWRALPSFNPAALLIAAMTVGIVVYWPKRWQKVPGSMVALTAATLAAWLLPVPVETIGSRFGQIPHTLPRPTLPEWDWTVVKGLFGPATTIALLAAIESLLSAVVADGMIGGKHKSNAELIAQGAANLVTPLFGGMPATGAIARTATNVRNGGRTPVAGILHAFTLVLILALAAPLAEHVPLASLAGILAVVSYHMSEWRSFRFILTGPRSDVSVLLTTFGLTVLVDLTVAVEVGMVLAAFLFMRKMAELTQVRPVAGDEANGEHLRDLTIPRDVQVFTVQGSFFFGAAHKVMELTRIVAKAPRALVLDLSGVLHMDASGLHVLEQIHRECVHRRIRFIIAGMHSQPLLVAHQTGQIRSLGEENFLPDLAAAIREVSPTR